MTILFVTTRHLYNIIFCKYNAQYLVWNWYGSMEIVFHFILEIFHSIPFLKPSIPFHSGIFHIPYRNFHSIPYHALLYKLIQAIQANHKPTNSAKPPKKLTSKLIPLLEYWNIKMNENKTTSLFILRQKLSNIPEKSLVRHNSKSIRA